MITAAVATVALAGLAGCADNSVKPGSSASPSTAAAATSNASATSAADQTKDVCDQAAGLSATASAALQAKFAELVAANGDQNKMLQIGTDLAKLASDWSSKLTDLSTKPINPQVKQALSDGATTIAGLANPATLPSTTPTQVQTQVQGLIAKITAACAA
jgi:hypothetical protein